MYMKTTVNCHYTPIKMAKIKNNDNKMQNASKNVEQLELMLLVECKIVQPLWKTVWRFLIKSNIHLSLFLGIYYQEK